MSLIINNRFYLILITILLLSNKDLNSAAIISSDIESSEKTLNTELLKAVKSGKILKVKNLIDQKANVNIVDENDYYNDSPLGLAVRDGNLDLAKLLIDAKANVNVVVKYGKSPLHSASHEKLTEILISSRANVNARDSSGNTPLSYGGNTKIVKLLLDAGCNVNAVDDNGNSALISAIINMQKDVIKLLINEGADVNIISCNGYKQIALTMAAATKGCPVEIIKLLLDGKANINIQNKEDKTALIIAIEKHNTDLAKFLIDSNIDISLQEKENKTALAVAIDEHNEEIVKCLINAKADVNSECIYGKKRIITDEIGWRNLRARGRNFENNIMHRSGKCEYGYLAKYKTSYLILAVRSRNLNIVELILKAGANLDIINDDGKRAIDYTVKEEGYYYDAGMENKMRLISILLENEQPRRNRVFANYKSSLATDFCNLPNIPLFRDIIVIIIEYALSNYEDIPLNYKLIS